MVRAVSSWTDVGVCAWCVQYLHGQMWVSVRGDTMDGRGQAIFRRVSLSRGCRGAWEFDGVILH